MSSPSLSIRILFEGLRSLGYASVSGTFAKVGTPTTNPARQIWVTNNTDAPMIFTTDILNNPSGEFMLLPGAAWIEDITSNKTQTEGFYLAGGTQLWVKQVSAPTTGNVYFSVMYGR